MTDSHTSKNRSLPQRKVYSVKVSPLNSECWHITLVCGHGHWVSQKTKPRLKTKGCGPCRDGAGR